MKKKFVEAKLSVFPLLRKAFKYIEADNGYDEVRPIINVGVPTKYLEMFKLAEVALRKVNGKKLGDIDLSDDDWVTLQDDIDARPEDSAFDNVVIPCNDNDFMILKAAGALPKEIKAYRKVANEFFDGELSETFTKKGKL